MKKNRKLIPMFALFTASLFIQTLSHASTDVTRLATASELAEQGIDALASAPGVWETTRGTQTCPNGTAASDACSWYNPGGGATCSGGCAPNAYEVCRCW